MLPLQTFKMITRYILGVVLLFFSIHSILSIKETLHFSALLDSLVITFSDLDPAYTTALNLSVSQGIPIQYNSPPSADPKIPRIIHHIQLAGPSRDDVTVTRPSGLPSINSDALTVCREENPNYTFHTWTLETGSYFLKESYPWFLETYNRYRYPRQRADALRYFLLWHYGGSYIESDISCRRPLDPLLDFSAWFQRENVKLLGVSNDIMASRPGHPVFGEIIQSLHEHSHYYYFPSLTISRSTGRGFVNAMLEVYWGVQGVQKKGRSPLDVANNQKSTKINLIEGTDIPYQYSGPGDIAILPRDFYDGEYGFFQQNLRDPWRFNRSGVWIWKGMGVVMAATLLSIAVILGSKRAVSYRITQVKSQDRFKAKSMVC
jgi:hypothetical protein